jgi:Xaa-Pro aminopeptidase
MRKSMKIRLVFAVAVVLTSLAVLLPAGSEARSEVKPPPPIIRITPPTPVIDEKERLAELAQRRARVAQSIGNKSFLILFSTEPRVYANDVDYIYRQENNLYYLTMLKQRGATLVLLPGNTQTPEILFLPKRSPAAETWTGHMYSPEEAKQASGVKEIWEAGEFKPFIEAIRNRQPYRPKAENIFISDLPAGTTMTNGNGFEPLLEAAGKNEASLYLLMTREMESREYKQEQRFGTDWVKTASGYMLKNAWPIFTEMRLKKSSFEVRMLQHAIDISTEAHERAWAAAGEAKWEYEVDAVMAYTFKLRNAVDQTRRPCTTRSRKDQ